MKSKKSEAAKYQDSDTIFEQAYILYRKNQNGEALMAIAKGDQSEVRFMELKAQLLYRLEKVEEALELYKKLLETHTDEYDDTRQANLMAVIALLESKGFPQQLTVHLESFEQMYNCAVHMIHQKKFCEAVKLLDSASEKCRETLEEDGLSENEIQEDLCTIQIQKAYALQMGGSTKEAAMIYSDVQKGNLGDTNLKAVVMNNILAMDEPPNIEENYKQLRDISKKRKARLTELQSKTIAFNLCENTTKKPKKRNRRLSKNYDPGVNPDPERWLPKKERSGFQKKKKLNAKRRNRH